MSEALTADEVIALFGLKPHPEGGHYRETFRDAPGHAAARIRPRSCIC